MSLKVMSDIDHPASEAPVRKERGAARYNCTARLRFVDSSVGRSAKDALGNALGRDVVDRQELAVRVRAVPANGAVHAHHLAHLGDGHPG